MSKCIECQHFDVRSFPEHTKQGQATCNQTAKFFRIEQKILCESFEMAGVLVINKRRAWRDAK